MSTLREIQERYVHELEERAEMVSELIGRCAETMAKARREKHEVDKLLRDARKKLNALGGGRELASGDPEPNGASVDPEERRAAVLEALRQSGRSLTRSEIGERVPGGGTGLHFLLASMLKQGEVRIAQFSDDPTYLPANGAA